MEYINQNLLQTTTSLVVDSNTATAENLLRRDVTYQYFTSGLNDDNTTSTMTITFDSTTTVSRLALMGHNLKEYTIYYNGATANTFAFTSTANTTTSDFSSNSETSQYFVINPTAVSSISIDMKSTIVADSEKAIGYLHVSDTLLDFERIPSAKDYKPLYNPKEVQHKLSDGGIRLHYLDKKFSTQIKFKYINETFRDALYTVWNSKDSFVFVPFGTSTGWDNILHEVVWPGKFDFYKYSDNAQNSGFSGTISLKEVS